MTNREVSFVAKYVYQKISVACWEPEHFGGLTLSQMFATGSWDDTGRNNICLWSISTSSNTENTGFGDDDNLRNSFQEPKKLCSLGHKGDVTDLLFLSNEYLVTSSSFGSVLLHKFDRSTKTLKTVHHWPSVHYQVKSRPPTDNMGSPCTSISLQGRHLATGGEDGRVNVIDLDSNAVTSINGAQSSCISDVAYVRHGVIAAVNTVGQFKLFDTREHGASAKTIVMNGSKQALHCLAQHPTQPHILVAGDQKGLLYVWDMRQDKSPFTLLQGHTSSLWDVKFHRDYPDHLFTCSEDGCLYHWHNLSEQRPVANITQSGNDEKSCDWSTLTNRQLEIESLVDGSRTLSINSLDLTDTRLICGTDSEQIILVRDLNVY